jgi:transaldolase/glucose-6-phosphate isomerase
MIGRFLQILHDQPRDVAIPGARYSFTTLKNAQATGDLQTLRSLGRPAERVRLTGEDPAGALRALTATIKEAR